MSTIHNVPLTRVFKTGTTVITESPEMRSMTIRPDQQVLKSTYPEVAHATVRERVEGETLVIDFLPIAARKG